MSKENKRIQEWLKKFALFESRSSLPELRYGPPREAILRRIKFYKFITQEIRREITRGLGELYETALRFAKDGTLDLPERERWTRLSVHIAQTINTIIDGYDTMKIEKTLEELKQYVKTNLEDGR